MLTDLTSFSAQKIIAKWTVAAAIGISAVTFLLDRADMAAGIIFSSCLTVLNYWALSLVPRVYQWFKSPYLAKVNTFAYYYLRFWLLVVIMYLTIPKFGYYFGLGCFIGFIIPKIAMGAIVIIDSGEDWWLHHKAPAETIPGPEKPKLTSLERELMNTNPFQFDIVDFELNKKMKR